MTTVSTEELRKKMQAGPVAVFDVRGDVDYEKGHIPGAKTAPLGALAFRVASIMSPDSYVVVYSSGNDTLAAEAAERLEDLRLRNVAWLAEGLEGWRKAGLPVAESPAAKLHTQGPAVEVRSIVVDRERAYGGAFGAEPSDEAVAGG